MYFASVSPQHEEVGSLGILAVLVQVKISVGSY